MCTLYGVNCLFFLALCVVLLVTCIFTLQALNWVFVVDTMNFSFWPEKETEQCEVTYKGTTYTGYMTLCASITRAMEEGESVCNSGFIYLYQAFIKIILCL